MSDVQRTRAQILALFADNVTGGISAQDSRDMIVTIMEPEFANPGDFWAEPSVANTTTDKDARGWKLYSQYIGSDCSFANILFMEASTGYWMRADVANSAMNGMVGMAMDSYTSDVSTATILMKGMVYNSDWSTTFSELHGRPLYLASGAPGSVVTVITDSELVIGWVMHSDNHGGSAIGKFYFQPDWAVKGV